MKNFPNHKVRFTIYRTVYEHRTVVVLTYKFITGEKRSSFRFVDVLEKKINDDHWRDYARINTCTFTRYFSRSSSREDWRHAVSVLPTETVKILSVARMTTLLERLNESKSSEIERYFQHA